MILGIKNYRIQELADDEVDLDLPHANNLYGSHVNLIPMQSNVAAPREFYGARFYNQAMPLKQGEAPLVQNLNPDDPEGRSFDDIIGQFAGALRSKYDGKVLSVKPNRIELETPEGKKNISLYNNFAFNRKSGITHRPRVKPGDTVKAGQLLASSNYTDDNGTLALGKNLRIGLIPLKGFSMDDAVVISNSAAQSLNSEHTYTIVQDFDNDTKGGLNHFRALFADRFTKDQLATMSEEGVVKPGTVLKPGDPMILATRPKVISSTTAQLGKLSKAMKATRSDASKVWDGEEEAVVTHTAKTKDGWKVVVQSYNPTKVGDKIVLRSGQKGVVAAILPDAHMLRGQDGKPMDVLLNPLGIPSRVNNSLPYELWLGKVAAKLGKPIKLPAYTKLGEARYDEVERLLKENGLTPTESVFDPMTGRKIENPVTTGVGYVLKLHHVAESKANSRGQGGYDCYDAETEVLTARGWIPWPEVREDDDFFTVDNDQATYRKASRVVSFDYDGELLGFENRYLDWLVTPNHEHLVKFSKPGSEWRKVKAEELHERSRYSVKQFGFGELPGVSPTQVTFHPNPPAHARKAWPSSSLPIDDYVELIGWWLSEGSVVYDEKNSRYRVCLWQSDIANPEKSKQIRALLNRLPYSWYRHFNTNGELVGYWISDLGLAQHVIEHYGRNSGDKRIWREVFKWAPEHRRKLYETMRLGDGCKSTHVKNSSGRSKPNVTESYVTKCEGLADDIQELCIGLGFGALIHEHPVASNGTYICQPYFQVGIHRTRTTASVVNGTKRTRYEGRYTRVPYKGKVYCATIPGTGLLYVRRNKKPLLSGNSWEQPMRGGGAGGGAKRLSGLEVGSLMSSGAYATLREGATLRGQKNDEYWRKLRMGQEARPKDRPFAWDKFRALLTGAGLRTKDLPGGVVRLGPVTDRDLDKYNPVEIRNGGLINLDTLEPDKGGLFDSAVVGNNAWGKITLPFPVINPAMEDAVRHLLGLKRSELRDILAGKMELPNHLR